MTWVLGIDLGTTNSVASLVRERTPEMIKDRQGRVVLPSVVGFDARGQLLVGAEARNQALLAPERTVKSIKRKMGEDVKISLGERQFTPQEISAMILRTLKERAEAQVGTKVDKAVITVPAFFNDSQRAATREAGELAGLEVVRIINEPTAATLTYQPQSTSNETILVYDLGGGTFDVSIVRIEDGIIEVLASHGDTRLGGDDFDQLLLDYVCEQFQNQHGVDLSERPVSRSRLLQAVEAAKITLSDEPVTRITEEFIIEKDGVPLHLDLEVERDVYETMIEPLIEKTVRCVDDALKDANLTLHQLDRVILVGGSSRTPLVQRVLKEQLQHEPRIEIDPDLCVAMGAAVQGALIAGVDVGPILVEITPHTLGIECLNARDGFVDPHYFSGIIRRNSPLPATKSEFYLTAVDGQEVVKVEVFQGEESDTRYNHRIGSLNLDGLDTSAPQGSQIQIRFQLNLDGMLHVTAKERATGRERQVVIQNAMARFQSEHRDEARSRLDEVFESSTSIVDGEFEHREAMADGPEAEVLASSSSPSPSSWSSLPAGSEDKQILIRAQEALSKASADDAEEIQALLDQAHDAVQGGDLDELRQIAENLEDILFYMGV